MDKKTAIKRIRELKQNGKMGCEIARVLLGEDCSLRDAQDAFRELCYIVRTHPCDEGVSAIHVSDQPSTNPVANGDTDKGLARCIVWSAGTLWEEITVELSLDEEKYGVSRTVKLDADLVKWSWSVAFRTGRDVIRDVYEDLSIADRALVKFIPCENGCGITKSIGEDILVVDIGGRRRVFCSTECQRQFINFETEVEIETEVEKVA